MFILLCIVFAQVFAHPIANRINEGNVRYKSLKREINQVLNPTMSSFYNNRSSYDSKHDDFSIFRVEKGSDQDDTNDEGSQASNLSIANVIKEVLNAIVPKTLSNPFKMIYENPRVILPVPIIIYQSVINNNCAKKSEQVEHAASQQGYKTISNAEIKSNFGKSERRIRNRLKPTQGGHLQQTIIFDKLNSPDLQKMSQLVQNEELPLLGDVIEEVSKEYEDYSDLDDSHEQ
ncbi:hypothetical protein GJ496_003481 [Pomphorhynchus laevis]|nr:hypothetical protein GJ496_003481 [Pomphorhynchus laevis]